MLWIKAFHIIAVISWFAGLFYLPRLFVYHAVTSDQLGDDRFIVMERKLYNYIMTPAAVIALALGTWLWLGYGITGAWLHAKLSLVVVLVVYHWFCYKYVLAFREKRNQHTHKFYRFFNEAPTLLLIAITILVVVKPF